MIAHQALKFMRFKQTNWISNVSQSLILCLANISIFLDLDWITKISPSCKNWCKHDRTWTCSLSFRSIIRYQCGRVLRSRSIIYICSGTWRWILILRIQVIELEVYRTSENHYICSNSHALLVSIRWWPYLWRLNFTLTNRRSHDKPLKEQTWWQQNRYINRRINTRRKRKWQWFGW